jgi:flagella basal body P-ring formation protein FlgA
MFRITLIILISLLAPHVRADDGSSRITRVDLRSTVRLGDARHLPTLGDIARISGEQSQALAGLAIDMDQPLEVGSWSLITQSDVRELIKQAQGINEGGIVLAGPDVRITRIKRQNNPDSGVQRSTPMKLEPNHPTLRQQLERWTIDRLDTSAAQSRIRFKESDLEDLSMPIAGLVVEVREIGRSDQMLLGVVVYENERVVLNRSFRFEVLVQRSVRVTTQQIRRSTMITRENTKVEQRWLSVAEPVVDPERAIGMITMSTIDRGRMVYSTGLEAPILVDRGQLVSARSIAGSVSVSMLARAKQSGRIGDIIELESKDRSQQFQARVAGPGQVVILKPNQLSSSTDQVRGVNP